MTDVTAVGNTTPTIATQPSSAEPSTAGAVASGTQNITGSSKVSSLDDLKKKSPKIYKAMLEGIGMNICNEMKAHQERLKQMMRDAENNS